MASGKVSIQVLKGRLRLYWSWGGQRYYLALQLPDNRLNRIVAEQKARQIEGDLATGNFDASLRKYQEHEQGDRTPVAELFARFMDWKARHVYSRSMEKYEATRKRLEEYFGKRTAASITERDAEKFRDWWGKELKPLTLRERIVLVRACWEWAQKQGLVKANPWGDLRVRVPPQPKPRPFTQDEVRRILEAFRASPHYSFYLDYVEFLFRTGARTGEVIGLRWQHVSPDCSQIWIGESLSRGVRKETKTNLARTLTVSPDVQEMLIRRRNAAEPGQELVFPAKNGGAIDSHDFRNRAWMRCLTAAGVDYRKPYMTRSTFISHCLAIGMNPADVAELTGHDIETLYREYAGSIQSTPKVPSLWQE